MFGSLSMPCAVGHGHALRYLIVVPLQSWHHKSCCGSGGGGYIWLEASSNSSVRPTARQRSPRTGDLATASLRFHGWAPTHGAPWALEAPDGRWRFVAQPVGSPAPRTGTCLRDSLPGIRPSDLAGHPPVLLAADSAVGQIASARYRYDVLFCTQLTHLFTIMIGVLANCVPWRVFLTVSYVKMCSCSVLVATAWLW